MLSREAPDKLARSDFSIERSSYAARLGEPPTTDQQKLYSACKDAFGENLHIAGAHQNLFLDKRQEENFESSPGQYELQNPATINWTVSSRI